MGGALQGRWRADGAIFSHLYALIELNPVRAQMVKMPANYRWSSYHYNAKKGSEPIYKPSKLMLPAFSMKSKASSSGSADDEAGGFAHCIIRGKF